MLDAIAMRRQHLLLQPANLQNFPPQRQFPRHCQVLPHRPLRQRRRQRCRHCHPRAGPILWNRPLRQVHMDVQILRKIRIDRKLLCVRANVTERRVRALLHHIAKFSRQQQLPLPRHRACLHVEQLAPHFRPRHADCVSDFRLVCHRRVSEFFRTQKFLQQIRRDGGNWRRLLVIARRHQPRRQLPADRIDLALQVTHPRLARVALNQERQPRLRHLELRALQPIRLHRLRDQVALRNLQLLQLRVARQPDDFHAVLQRQRNVLRRVRRRDEQHPRQVIININVVIIERLVLLRIQHLQQRRRRIAAEVAGHLVDLIQQQHRIHRPRLLHRLHNFSRQRPNVRAPVPANFRLVPHPTQRNPRKLPPHATRDAPRQRRLPDPRRTHETQDRPRATPRQLRHRKVLDDPLLDLLQAVMILVQHLLRAAQVDAVLRHLLPRNVDHPFNVGARHRRLRR